MDAEQTGEEIKRLIRAAERYKKAGDIEKMGLAAETAMELYRLLAAQTKRHPAWLKKVPDDLRPFLKDEGVLGKKDKKCSYRMLTDGEIKKLKANGYDPHDLKDDDPWLDLFKCKPSGKVAVGRKSWHQDEDGNLVPGGTTYDDTCINIDSMQWQRKGIKVGELDQTIIEYRVSDLTKPLSEVLEKLPVPPDRSHRKGERRGKSILTYSQDWFAYSAETKNVRFDEAVAGLVKRLYKHRDKIRKACGTHKAQLSCIFYFDSSHRPYIHFAPETLALLDKMGAAIDVDLYPMRSDEEE